MMTPFTFSTNIRTLPPVNLVKTIEPWPRIGARPRSPFCIVGKTMTDREHRLILQVLSVAEDLVRHSGENPTVVLSEYQQRLANAWNINPHDVSLSPDRGTHEAGRARRAPERTTCGRGPERLGSAPPPTRSKRISPNDRSCLISTTR